MEVFTGLRSQGGVPLALGNGKKKIHRHPGGWKALVTNGVVWRPVSHTGAAQ